MRRESGRGCLKWAGMGSSRREEKFMPRKRRRSGDLVPPRPLSAIAALRYTQSLCRWTAFPPDLACEQTTITIIQGSAASSVSIA